MVVPFIVYSAQQKGQILCIYTLMLLPLFTRKMWHEESFTHKYFYVKKKQYNKQKAVANKGTLIQVL